MSKVVLIVDLTHGNQLISTAISLNAAPPLIDDPMACCYRPTAIQPATSIYNIVANLKKKEQKMLKIIKRKAINSNPQRSYVTSNDVAN